jgi:hypothetical protein
VEDPARPDLPAAAAQALRLLLSELKALLDAVPGSRQVLRAAAVLEKALAKQGLVALDELPSPVLQRAHQQLSRLPLPKEARHLRQLLSLLQLALHERRTRELQARAQAEQAADPRAAEGYRSSFLGEDKLEVRTATDSEFRRALEDLGQRPA